MSKFSFSQVGVYQQCPKKYQFKYVEKIPEEFKKTPELLLGSSVHAALEFLYNQVNDLKTPSVDDVLTNYQEYWKEELDKLNEAGEILETRNDMTIDDYKRKWEFYIKSYFDKNQPFTDTKVIGTEINLSFDVSDGVFFNWFVDRLDKVGDTFIINDYKTNKNLPPENKEMYQEQLNLYAVGVKQKYGKYFTKLKAKLHYLHFDIVDEREITDEMIQNIQEKYKNLAEEIDLKKSQFNSDPKNTFPAIKWTLCRFCAFQMICPVFIHRDMDDEMISGELKEWTIKSLIDEYAVFSQQESDNKKQKEMIKKMLEEYVSKKEEDIKVLYGNTNKLSISTLINYKTVDEKQLEEYLREHNLLDQAMNIDRFKLKKMFDKGELSLEELPDIIEKNESLSFRVGKNK